MSESTPEVPHMMELVESKPEPRCVHLASATFELMIEGFIAPQDHEKIIRKIQKRCSADGIKLAVIGTAPVAPHHPKH